MPQHFKKLTRRVAMNATEQAFAQLTRVNRKAHRVKEGTRCSAAKTETTVDLYTQNVRGLTSDSARASDWFTHLRQRGEWGSHDIVFLQETHCGSHDGDRLQQVHTRSWGFDPYATPSV